MDLARFYLGGNCRDIAPHTIATRKIMTLCGRCESVSRMGVKHETNVHSERVTTEIIHKTQESSDNRPIARRGDSPCSRSPFVRNQLRALGVAMARERS